MSFQEQIMSHYLKWTAATVGKVFRGKLDLQNETTVNLTNINYQKPISQIG